MIERTYTISELKTLIKESANEFKAKIGDSVNSNNKKENEKTYSNAKKKIKDFDGGGNEMVENEKVPEKMDGNKTTIDYNIEGADDNYRKRVKAQAEGYTSTLEKNNKIDKAAYFSDKSYKQFKKSGEEMHKNAEDIKKTGLQAREMPKDSFKKPDMYESRKISVLNFKNTTFINESQMLSRIPDDFKVNGKKFKVKDAGENEFIVEWKDNEANIISYENKKKLNETIEKFQKLSNYNSKNENKKTTAQSRLFESSEFNNMLNKVRIITDKK